VPVASDVVVLEHGLEVDALVLNLGLVLIEDVNDLLLHRGTSQVLSAGKEGIVLSDRSDTSGGRLIDTLNSERCVDVLAEIDVAEEALRVRSLVLLGEGLELIVGEGEVHGAENGFELGAGHAALPQLVKVAEELFNTDALHDYDGLQAVLNVARVVRDVDVVLHEAIVDDINALSGLLEEGGDLLGADANLLELLWHGALGLVLGEHVFGAVNILAEVVVIDFFGIATVAVTASDEVEQVLAGRHNVQSLAHAKELLRGDVLRLGAIEVHEAGLKQDAVRHDVSVQVRHHLDHLVFLFVCEHGGGAGVLNNLAGVDGHAEDGVEAVYEVAVAHETRAVLHLVLVEEHLGFSLGQAHAEGANASAESGFSDSALAQFVEVNEKLPDTNAVSGNARLNAPLDVGLVTQLFGLSLIVGLVTMRRGAHVLHVIGY